MQTITEGKSRAKVTSAMIQKQKLDVAFELKAKYGITKGTVVHVTRPMQGRTRIDKDPLPADREETETEFKDFHAEDNCLYVGAFWDHWSGKMFLEFIAPEGVLYYDYAQHGAGDKSFGEIFKVEVAATTRHSVI